MRVLELWRHPVKSFQGERLEEAELVADGLASDRAWGVRDNATGKMLTGRREPQLLLASARLGDDGLPSTTLPDGTTTTGLGPETDSALSAWLGHDVSLVAATDVPPQQAEVFVDHLDDTGAMDEWTMPPNRFVDALPLLLLTTASLRTGASLHPDGVWDVRRFRPNVLIDADGDGWPEDAWVGQEVRIGNVVAQGVFPCPRCTMVTRPQPGGLERDLDVFRTLNREHGANFGLWASVVTPGTVRAGDEVSV
ncbi:MAG TPA: MOSC N-terminal beta barrel domain-containing protein [Acidimicrobiales bacterium]|nr:MOSC N-terminal beta barrel domain-containing protein [Acidimicrobiales bacterium]